MRVIPTEGAVELDPSSMPPESGMEGATGAKIIIDATKKWEYPAVSLPPREYLERVIQDWNRYELPALGSVQLPRGL
jgi:4-hydroxy-3-polyprenylbenzoate decarboxylase